MRTGVFLLLGTNVGDRNKNLTFALQAIASTVGKVKKRSSVYETAAWGKTDQPPFFNQAIEIETALSSQKVLDKLLSIEQKMGRKRNGKWSERIIDIDILLFGDQIIETERLIIPHPELANRRFTLTPLSEIAADSTHPKLQKRIKELLAVCPDQLAVVKLTG